MNKVKRISGIIITIIFLAIAIVGCNNTSAEVNVTNDKNNNNYNKELSKYFPSQQGKEFIYSGTAEYGQKLVLDKIEDNKSSLTLDFKGNIIDISQTEGKKEVALEEQYLIGKDSVKVSIKNKPKAYSQSIIDEQEILRLPIEENNSWNQKVIIDGKEYGAKTEILKIDEDEKGNKNIKIQTTVDGVKGYPNDTYVEKRVYKQEKGLVGFEKKILFGEGLEPLDFQYNLFEN